MDRISSPRLFDHSSLFLTGVRAGELTFVAQDARGPNGSIGPARDAGSQARRTLENLRTALGEVGQKLEDVISLWVLLTNYDDADSVARVLDDYFPNPERTYPAVCFLGVTGLDGGCAVRMDAIASASQDRSQISVSRVPLSKGSRCHGVRLGDLYFLSGIDAGEEAIVGAELYAAMAQQVNTILDRTEASVKSQRLSLSDIFRNYNFLCHMADLSVQAAHRDARRQRLGNVFKPEEFPAQSRIGIRTLGQNVLQRSVVIATGDRRKTYVSSDKVRMTPSLFSQSVRVGDWLFIAGQDSIGLDQKTIGAGDMVIQTEESMMHIKDIVEAAGGTLDDVVKTTVYVLEGQDLAPFASTYKEFFKTHKRSQWMPAGLTLGVEALAPDCVVEIDAVAYLGSKG
ncbi:MAG: RidA family protein [Deltaproteobacteria bacterium]|nr:RidA family protein [Deltaproteobacteria bacterium]